MIVIHGHYWKTSINIHNWQGENKSSEERRNMKDYRRSNKEMTKLKKCKLFATFMIFVDKLDPFARKKVAFFLTTKRTELKKGLAVASSCWFFSFFPSQGLGKKVEEKGLVSKEIWHAIHNVSNTKVARDGFQPTNCALLSSLVAYMYLLSRWCNFSKPQFNTSASPDSIQFRLSDGINKIGYLRGGWVWAFTF